MYAVMIEAKSSRQSRQIVLGVASSHPSFQQCMFQIYGILCRVNRRFQLMSVSLWNKPGINPSSTCVSKSNLPPVNTHLHGNWFYNAPNLWNELLFIDTKNLTWTTGITSYLDNYSWWRPSGGEAGDYCVRIGDWICPVFDVFGCLVSGNSYVQEIATFRK